MKTVFIRNDDVGPLTKELQQVSYLLWENHVPVSHAVIPGQLTLDCVAWLHRFLAECPELLEIHQHGWKHIDHGNKAEFGPERRYQEQYQDIAQGKSVLYHFFGTEVFPCFTPPWHRYTTDTLQILAELEFSGFSTKHTHKIPAEQKYPFQMIPIHLNLLKRANQGWVVKSEEEWQAEWQALRLQTECVGILLHHEHFQTRKDLDMLQRFINVLQREGVIFQKLGDLVKSTRQ